MENGETCKEDTKFWLTYIKGLVLFAIEGEGHGEGQLLRGTVIKFGVFMVFLVQTIGVEQGCCRKAEVEVMQDQPPPRPPCPPPPQPLPASCILG